MLHSCRFSKIKFRCERVCRWMSFFLSYSGGQNMFVIIIDLHYWQKVLLQQSSEHFADCYDDQERRPLADGCLYIFILSLELCEGTRKLLENVTCSSALCPQSSGRGEFARTLFQACHRHQVSPRPFNKSPHHISSWLLCSFLFL